ncbi:hypothetical protein [Sandaracinus amylolyticus]|uniref:Succinate dehydrogenase cytochrome b558 subunit n=1 Tax=Sandaracinus amylolyticus TaxID=927083 RepID=A0A0F6SF66_9BACT|nr:hypothetical protein [Sandaracinus amylolyticus]AKF06409.1 hypothetical protein DB32_003558 [Sandaracinus amylolyticus]
MQRSRKRLLLVQAISGATFATFALAHLVNVLLAPIPGAFDAVASWMRPIYTHPLIEFGVMLVPLVVHVVVGVMLALDRRRRGTAAKPDVWARAHRWSGWFLATVIVGHTAAERGIALAYGIVTGGPSVSFALWWQPVFFYPYFLLLGSAGLYHTLFGLSRAARLLGVRVPRVSARARPLAAGALVASVVLAIVAWGGWLNDVGDPTDNDYARVYESWGLVELP